ncbi:MAG: ABC transporter ATP-binding protein [Acidimicrobiia bacterium]
MSEPVLALDAIRLVYDGRAVLDGVDWTVRTGERWVVLGRNGSGKTSLVRISSLYLHPSSGTVTFLGEQLGRMDVRRMRRRIGLASSSLASQLRPQLDALDIVMTAKNAALEPWWHTYDDDDRARARHCLDRFGLAAFAPRAFATLSSGEQQRVLLARTFMNDPALVLLDEPTAGLDLRGREELVATLSALARSGDETPLLLVTHHVDEIPPGFTHCLLLAEGQVLAAGPIDETLTSQTLSDCFGLPLDLERRGERFSAFAR